MPNYTLLNTNTSEVETVFMSISEKEEFLKKNAHYKQLPSSFSLCDPIRMGIRKPDDSFRDVLREIKKNHSMGITKSTINTF